MNKPATLGLVERAKALVPLIAREADEIERTRRLTPPVVSALIENGLYRSLLPQSVGGAEAEPKIFMQMLEEIAKVDASTAWCLGQCSVCGMTAAYLDLAAAHEIFGASDSVLAWGAVANEVQVVPGGYRVTARWDFASGSRQANWLGAHVRIVEADGTKRLKPNGSPELRTIVFPMSSATMYDVWDVIGLRGTGTDSYSVDNLFIPEKHVALRDDPTGLRETGPLYAFTTFSMFGLGFAAISVGVGRAMLDAVTELSRGKASVGLKAMRVNNAVLAALGRMEGNLRAARAYIYSAAGEAWNEATQTGKLSEETRMALRVAATWTIHQAASVVDAAYHMAGATGVFPPNPSERRVRDMHAIAQQIQARDNHYEDVGRFMLDSSATIPRGPTN